MPSAKHAEYKIRLKTGCFHLIATETEIKITARVSLCAST